MDTKKVVIVLLIIAIVFSVISVIINLSADKSFVSGDNSDRSLSSSPNGGGQISLTVLPNSIILGVLNAI
jgi:hypothetical protein